MPFDEIKDKAYDLSINKYKEIEYKPIEYDPSDVILGRIEELEKEIQKELAELKELLKNENSDL